MGLAYQVQLTGTTYSGNSGVPEITPTEYYPLENFSQAGILTVENPIPASNSNNGQNVLDVGLFAGNVFDSNDQAGELEFATNTAIFAEIGFGNFSQSAAIDVTSQTYDPQTNTLTIQIDPVSAPSAQLNTFIKTTSSLSAPAEIIQGQIQIQFSNDNQQIAGTVSLLGNGYIQPGISLYQASFTGTLAQSFTGLAEG